GLCAATYSVTVTDNKGCSSTATATVIQPATVTVTVTTTNANCGQSDGSATATANSGVTPYSYLWPASAGSQTNSTATGLSAGSYAVTVSDANGCTAAATAAVTDNNGPTVSITGNVNVSCFNGSDGQAIALVIDGMPPYTYQWNDPQSQTTATATGLPTGTFTVLVTDVNGCIASVNIVISQPSVVAATVSTVTTPSCSGSCNGNATVIASGGTGSYSYLWSNSQTGSVASGLCSGIYSITVSDANGCSAINSVTLTEPGILTPVTTSADASCEGACDGSATASISGGTPPYTLQWNDPLSQTTGTATGLCAGIYIVTATDDNGCMIITSVPVGEPGQVTVSVGSKQDVECNGDCDGYIQVIPGQGTPPYSYTWSNGQTNNITTGLCAGSYSVTVSDSKGCTAVLSSAISQPNGLLLSINKTDASCYGNYDGMVSATVSGGTPPWSYQWDDPTLQTSATATGLQAGNYNLTVTDNNGCTVSGSISVSEPIAIILSIDTNGSHCLMSDGEAIVTISGGSFPPFSYLWSAGSQTTSNATGLSAGTYTVTVTDATGCTAVDIINVSDLGSPAVTIASQGDATCYGGCDGFATALVSGGTPPYTYTWNDPGNQTNALATGLCAGNYTVSIIDPNGCSSNISTTIGQAFQLVATVTSTVPATCNGYCDGTATVLASGGTPPYFFYWNDPLSQNTQTASGLCAGSYSVITEDANGCTTVNPVTITEPPVLTINATGTDAHCGIADGSAVAVATGGNGTYAFTWSNSQAGDSTVNITAGVYTVTVTDIYGCSGFSTVTINNISGGSASISNITNVNCNGENTGSGSVSISGGTSPFTYLWSNGQSNSTATGLAAGNYTISVSDFYGCVTVASCTITQPPVLAVTTTTDSVSCTGLCDGDAYAVVSGGISPYSFQWDDPLATQNYELHNVCSGIYQVTITDGNGCTATGNAAITEPVAFILSVSQVDASCGQADGSAAVTASGGSPPYTYNWSNGQTLNSILNLVAGIYTITVTDANNCVISTPATISNLNGPVIMGIISDSVSCSGGNDGSATVAASGGTPPLSYQWDDPFNQSAPAVVNLPAGTYTIVVRDANGCAASAPVTIYEPLPMVYNINTVNPSCNNYCDGSAYISVTGGTPPYSYQWNTGNNSDTLQGVSALCAGYYDVVITDFHGCITSGTALITDPQSFTVSITVTANSCYNSCDGTATANTSGGYSPYTYQWNDNNNQVSQTAYGLCAGTYSVTVTDNKGCSLISSASVTQPVQIGISLVSSGNNNCFGSCTGYAQVNATGGIPAFTYIWSDNQGNSQAINLCAGLYTVTVTDSKGCTASLQVTITQPQQMASSVTWNNATCYGSCNGNVFVSVSGGVLPYTYLWDDPSFQTAASAGNLCADQYTVTVTDNKGCSITRQVIITEPQLLDFTFTAIPSTCGNPNGQACISVTGGVSPYVITWNDPMTQVGACAFNLYANAYTATLADANGCMISKPVAVNDITGPVIDTLISTDVTCGGDSNGTASVIASGVALPFTYIWKKGITVIGNNTFISGLPGGTYTVTVLDTNGCSTSAIVAINEPTVVASAIVNKTDATCAGSCNGTAYAMAGGGTSPYIFTWDLAQTGQTATGLCAGTHALVVSDYNGCQTVNSVSISEPLPILLNPLVTNPSCSGTCDGMITLLPGPTGGTPFYSYSWTPNSGNGPTITNLCTNVYYVTVTDIRGCTALDTAVVIEPAPLSFVSSSTPSTCGFDNGSAAIMAIGGTSPYSYFWPDGQTTAIVSNLEPRDPYYITLTDSNGCALIASVTVLDYPGPVIDSLNTLNLQCNNDNSGSATVYTSGGTPPIAYLWSNGSPLQTAIDLGAGIVYVTVTDYNGCTDSEPAFITQPEPIQPLPVPSDTICYGSYTAISASFNGGTLPFTYIWDNGLDSSQGPHVVKPFATTAYAVYIIDANGCHSVYQTITVSVLPPLVVTASSAGNICTGNSTTVYAAATGGDGPPYSFTWLNNGYQDSIMTVSPFVDSTFTVIGSDGCSVNDTDTVTVRIHPYPIPVFTFGDISGCVPLIVQFIDQSSISTGSITQWSWVTGDGQTASVPDPAFTFNTPGSFDITLTVTSGYGCDTSVNVFNVIHAFPIPDAYFVPVPDETTLLLSTIQFNDGSSGNVVTWSWNFGEPASGGDNASSAENPAHTYLDTGIYIVELNVISDSGCPARYVDSVIIKPDYVLFVPSAFTPDNDGHNDYFFPEGVGIDPDNFEMHIYDRWGDLIYYTDDVNKPWNGKANKGKKPAQQDVYIWMIKTKDFTDVKHEYIGHVTLIK
ncbi:MAG: gliding motility-associated C-terminal domain-containing protein, partial [Bacteroidetes bacterium]|nr:gliding motility-associated C-terminal domain-containing protein [Bacteroidota bacterium]